MRFYTGLLILLTISFLAPQVEAIEPSQARHWIVEMKNNPRGPFTQIRWFCRNGKILPPTRVGCAGNGGGVQHGELNDKAAALRRAGYPIATLFASFSESDMQQMANSNRDLAAMILERYLVIADDGWVFKNALTYRGAMQEEDEGEGAEKVLNALLSSRTNSDPNYLLIREAARVLALDKDSIILNEVRADSRRLATTNSRFIPLRNKLHAFPEPEDIQKIIQFANDHSRSGKGQRNVYLELARKLERVFSPSDLSYRAKVIIRQLPDSELRDEIEKASETIDNPKTRFDLFWALSDIIYYTRKYFHTVETSAAKRNIILFSIQAERTLLKKWSDLVAANELSLRQDKLQFLLPVLQAAYGSGLLSERGYRAAAATVNGLLKKKSPPLSEYLKELRYLSKVSTWAAAEMEWHFHDGLELMRPIEPLVDGYVGDRLHSSLLLAFSNTHEKLLTDASVLAGLQHSILGQPVAHRISALNPGLSRGILTIYQTDQNLPDMKDRIVLAQNTESFLPAVAGILTMNEGNSLSHIQLLARNLGIPNAVVGQEAINVLQPYIGKKIVLAVSPAGKVMIDLYSPKWDELFNKKQANLKTLIEPDVDRLDLDETELLPLEEIDASDSGKLAGPKAAKLGELKQLFPDLVSNGLVIPFGVFNEVLQKEVSSDVTLFDWLSVRYKNLATLIGTHEKYEAEKNFILTSMKSQIQSSAWDPKLKKSLHEMMMTKLGNPDYTGVFVRSDTNVEDLAGFSGAGLNLTVPNVLGFDAVLKAIKDVWESPFQDRSFSWRQGRMTSPEHVYTSVLLQKTVPADKSGVLITSDLDSGSSQYFTVATNFGLTGAVNNQRSEVLSVDRDSGEVRLLSEATERTMKIASLNGGLENRPVNQISKVLDEDEIAELMDLIPQVNKHYRKLISRDKPNIPADIEFGFVKGKLYLFQIRPYLQSLEAQQNAYLLDLDKNLVLQSNKSVPLNALTIE